MHAPNTPEVEFGVSNVIALFGPNIVAAIGPPLVASASALSFSVTRRSSNGTPAASRHRRVRTDPHHGAAGLLIGVEPDKLGATIGCTNGNITDFHIYTLKVKARNFR
jgi:hypothetical protein